MGGVSKNAICKFHNKALDMIMPRAIGLRQSRRYNGRLQKRSAVGVFFEANQTNVVGQQEWAFDELAIPGQKINGLGFGHSGQSGLQIQIAILLPGRVEQLAQIAIETGQHPAQIPGRWRGLNDIDGGMGNAVGIEKLERLATGTAIGVVINGYGHGNSW